MPATAFFNKLLDESCYREVGNSDILVLIIGGRYGSEASSSGATPSKTFYDRYNSITRGEYQSALKRDIPIYVLIEKSVHAEYETYLKNKMNQTISYAHVDSVNIFDLIEYILSQPRNNPVQHFERYGEIEAWLKEQWAGLFRELLQRMQGQQQMASIQVQVGQLSELNTTLKRYLEEIVSKIAPNESELLINTETQRLKDAEIDRIISQNPLGVHLIEQSGLASSAVRKAFLESTSAADFLRRLQFAGLTHKQREVVEKLQDPFMESLVTEDMDRMRRDMGLSPFETASTEEGAEVSKTDPRRKRSPVKKGTRKVE